MSTVVKIVTPLSYLRAINQADLGEAVPFVNKKIESLISEKFFSDLPDQGLSVEYSVDSDANAVQTVQVIDPRIDESLKVRIRDAVDQAEEKAINLYHTKKQMG